MAAGFAWTDAEASAAGELAQAAQAAAATGVPFTPKFFTAHEWQTVRLLVDIIIPRDERSGSATDAGVPEFMDFMMIDQPARQVAMRGGLAWLDRDCERRFDKRFVACSDAERATVLDDIAWGLDGKSGARARPASSDRRVRRRVLQQLPRSHRDRVLDDAGWGSRICSYMGNRAVRVERVSGRGVEKARGELCI